MVADGCGVGGVVRGGRRQLDPRFLRRLLGGSSRSDLATDPGVPPISSTSFKSPVSSMVNPAIFASTTRAFLADAVG